MEVLEKGVHTYNEWALVTERWVESQPPDYLQYISVWVQIRNIPVNHRTAKAITALGELIGRIDEVVFDETKAQSRDFVRVRVRLMSPNLSGDQKWSISLRVGRLRYGLIMRGFRKGAIFTNGLHMKKRTAFFSFVPRRLRLQSQISGKDLRFKRLKWF